MAPCYEDMLLEHALVCRGEMSRLYKPVGQVRQWGMSGAGGGAAVVSESMLKVADGVGVVHRMQMLVRCFA